MRLIAGTTLEYNVLTNLSDKVRVTTNHSKDKLIKMSRSNLIVNNVPWVVATTSCSFYGIMKVINFLE